MKRSEMLDLIRDEIIELHEGLNLCTAKRKPHYLKYRTDSMLDMIEGLGMIPPKWINREGVNEFPPDGMECVHFTWEPEDDNN